MTIEEIRRTERKIGTVGKKFQKHMFCALFAQGYKNGTVNMMFPKEWLVVELCKRMSKYLGGRAFKTPNIDRVRYTVWFMED